MQEALMRFDPTTGEPNPYPSHAAQYRKWHGLVAWLYNPWTGNKRHPADIGSDVQGTAIVPPNTVISGDCPECGPIRPCVCMNVTTRQ